MIIDVSDPGNPRELAFIPIKNPDGSIVGSHTHTLDWPYLYINQYQSTYHRVEVFSLADPAKPVKVGEADFGESQPGFHDSYVDHRPDGRVLLYAGSDSANDVVDVTDPTKPKLVQRVVDPEVTFSHQNEPDFQRDTALVTDEYLGGAAGPSCGKVEDRVSGVLPALPGAGDPTDLGALHLYALKPDGTFGDKLSTFNLPSQPNDDPESGCTIHVFWQAPDQDRLVTAWYGRGIRVVDYSDPKAVEELASFIPTGTNVWAAKPHNGYIFTGDLNRGLDVLKYTGGGLARDRRRRPRRSARRSSATTAARARRPRSPRRPPTRRRRTGGGPAGRALDAARGDPGPAHASASGCACRAPAGGRSRCASSRPAAAASSARCATASAPAPRPAPRTGRRRARPLPLPGAPGPSRAAPRARDAEGDPGRERPRAAGPPAARDADAVGPRFAGPARWGPPHGRGGPAMAARCRCMAAPFDPARSSPSRPSRACAPRRRAPPPPRSAGARPATRSSARRGGQQHHRRDHPVHRALRRRDHRVPDDDGRRARVPFLFRVFRPQTRASSASGACPPRWGRAGRPRAQRAGPRREGRPPRPLQDVGVELGCIQMAGDSSDAVIQSFFDETQRPAADRRRRQRRRAQRGRDARAGRRRRRLRRRDPGPLPGRRREAGPLPAAAPAQDAPPAPPASTPIVVPAAASAPETKLCKVPKLRGLTDGAATKKLRAAGCEMREG